MKYKVWFISPLIDKILLMETDSHKEVFHFIKTCDELGLNLDCLEVKQ